jgi:uncharacterized protein with HEPN domain
MQRDSRAYLSDILESCDAISMTASSMEILVFNAISQRGCLN